MRAMSFVRWLLGACVLLAGVSALAAEPDALARIAAQVEQDVYRTAETVAVFDRVLEFLEILEREFAEHGGGNEVVAYFDGDHGAGSPRVRMPSL